MNKALDGAHYCATHQGNHSHYAKESCVVCQLVVERDEYHRQNQRLRSDLRVLETQYSVQACALLAAEHDKKKAEASLVGCAERAANAE